MYKGVHFLERKLKHALCVRPRPADGGEVKANGAENVARHQTERLGDTAARALMFPTF